MKILSLALFLFRFDNLLILSEMELNIRVARDV